MLNFCASYHKNTWSFIHFRKSYCKRLTTQKIIVIHYMQMLICHVDKFITVNETYPCKSFFSFSTRCWSTSPDGLWRLNMLFGIWFIVRGQGDTLGENTFKFSKFFYSHFCWFRAESWWKIDKLKKEEKKKFLGFF